MATWLFYLAVLLFIVPSSMSDHDLSDKYQFNLTLHERYTLYWTYNPQLQNISFAVRVRTTGWVGFGLSPNGQMPGSDVVIGWVQDGRGYFNDRFAAQRSTPPIDESQDWILTNSEESNGHTTLEFTRNYTSCDPNNTDLNIDKTGTSRIVWSFKEEDPPNGAEGTFTAHDYKGSRSVNLLGGLLNPPSDPPGTQSFTLAVDQVTIPSVDTTYWCAGFKLPQFVQDRERYIIKASPLVDEGNEAYVHHMLIYLCDELNTTAPDGPCHNIDTSLRSCFSGLLIGAWAIGGEDFVYPRNIAYPIGGNEYRYAAIQMHYDNPHRVSGVVDSSGMTFHYIDTPRKYDAGILDIGHFVSPLMIIPPKAENYTVYGYCSPSCTQHFPPEGIHIFANILHTHLLGTKIELLHLRRTEQCRDGKQIEELKPIDKNLHYDFNFQQTVHIDEVIVKPGDMLIVVCTYDSRARTGVSLGGESTREEMCLSFPIYYPRSNISECRSKPGPRSFTSFVINDVPPALQGYFASLSQRGINHRTVNETFNRLDWTPSQINGLESSLLNSDQLSWCNFTSDIYGNGQLYNYTYGKIPSINCPYKEPNKTLECPDSFMPPSGAGSLVVGVFALLVLSLIAFIIN